MWYSTPDGKVTKYWDLPDKQIPNNSRVGSVSVFFAIMQKYHKCDVVTGPPTKPVYALIRDPFKRFISARAKGVVSQKWGNHFRLQIEQIVGIDQPVHLYKFPEHLEQFGKDVGLEIGWVNTSYGKRPLSWLMKKVVAKLYSADVKLFAAITKPGIEFGMIKL